MNNQGAQKLELLVHDKDNSEWVGELAKSQCAAAGIDLEIQKLSFNAAVGRILKGDAQAFVLSFEYVFSTPELVLGGFFAKDAIPMPNVFRYDSPETAELISRMMAAPSGQSEKVAALLEEKIIQDAPAAFLFEKRAAVVFRKDLAGVRLSYNNILPFEEVIVGK